MKIDSTKHKYSWCVQKGCRVEWFVGSKKCSGVVTKVFSSNAGSASEVQVLDDTTQSEMVIRVDRVRIVKTKNTLRKEQ